MKNKVLIAIMCFFLVFAMHEQEFVMAAGGYSYYLDENCTMENAYWIIEYSPQYDLPWYELIYKSFLSGTFSALLNPDTVDSPKDKLWLIHDFVYEFDYVNLHDGEMVVGYLPEYYSVWFDFVFSSCSDESVVQTSRYTKSYNFTDYYNDTTGKFSITFDYEDLLLLSGFPADNNTVLSAVTVYVMHNSFYTYGTEEHFSFSYRDGNFGNSVIDVMTYSRVNPSDGVLFETTETILVDDDSGIMRLSNYQVDSDRYDENVLDLSSFYKFLVDSVSIVWDVINFLFDFVSMLPRYIALLIPFIPDKLIYGFFYAILFGLIMAVVRLVVSLIGKLNIF